MNDIDLDKLHAAQFSIACEVKRICEKFKIDYFLIAGSALGAVRHNGFIPWDDDLDIGMTRCNYEKFIECAAVNLNELFFLQNLDSDKNYPYIYTKIRIKNTKLIEYSSKNCKCHNGIYIDIFPFDSKHGGFLGAFLQKITINSLKYLLFAKHGISPYSWNDSITKYIIYYIIINPIAFFTPRFLLVKLHHLTIKIFHDSFSYEMVVLGGSYGYNKETVLRDWMVLSVDWTFCEKLFKIPKYWNNYLTHLYGDYMMPPPIERRKSRHGLISVSFFEDK